MLSKRTETTLSNLLMARSMAKSIRSISVSRDAKTLIIKNELLDRSGEKVTWSEVWRRI